MGKIFLILFLGCCISACQSAVPVQRGFIRVSDAPLLVQKALDNVVQIHLQRYQNLPMKYVPEKEMSKCIPGAQTCNVLFWISCSGFLIQPNLLLTAKHCSVQDFGLANSTPLITSDFTAERFRIENRLHKVIFQPDDEDQQILEVQSPCQFKVVTDSSMPDLFSDRRCDFAILRLSKPLDGIQVIPQAAPNQKKPVVYAVGYPKATQYFALKGGLDSNGIDLQFSKGSLDDPEKIIWDNRKAIEERNPHLQKLVTENQLNDQVWGYLLRNSQILKSLKTNLVWIRGEGLPGMSGGPILDSEGKWISIVSMGMKESDVSTILSSEDSGTPFIVGPGSDWIHEHLNR